MKEGFSYLETGKYENAKLFFESILNEYPSNMTAKLCYGRALGLSGSPKKAIIIFTELRNAYPDSFEVKLNYAESLLWDEQYENAEAFYQSILEENNQSFSAVLGYANTLSNLKKYDLALQTVNKALQIQPKNPNAMISRKYVRLGKAGVLSQNKLYDEALILLDQNLIDFPNDKDTQLNRANIFLVTNEFEKAQKVYYTFPINDKDSITSLNGLSLVSHKMYQNKEALKIATESVEKAKKFQQTDLNVYLSAQERYVQALLWNQKFVVAKKTIEKLNAKYPDQPRIWALASARGMYTSDFKTSLTNYKAILSENKSAFDGNLGIANTYKALGNGMKAYEYAFRTLHYFPKQPDAEQLIKDLKISHSPFIENKNSYSEDNGDNQAYTISLHSEIPWSTRFISKFGYSFRDTKNEVTSTQATAHQFQLGGIYNISKAFSFQGLAGINKAEGNTNTYNQWVAEAQLSTKIHPLHLLDIGYKREMQSFNASLTDLEIVMNHYYLTYNLNTNFNLGWYTQAMYTSQNDENIRTLLFTSLYYNLLKRPALKVGINYQHITFQNQVPTIYFSPATFYVYELFAGLLNNQKSNVIYSLDAAAGIQFVEDDPSTNTFRAQGKLGYKFSDRFKAYAFANYSNIASATATGFQFSEYGFTLKWHFLPYPIFNEKIEYLKKNIP